MWRFIKSLNGSPSTNAPNEAMKINGRVITSTKKKAEAFAVHYAKVSKLKILHHERAFNRRLKKLIKSQKGSFSIPELTMAELKSAITKMRRKGAPGSDDITPAFLKELGPAALKELLDICNLSLRSAECPQWWRDAIIIPLLKAGKPPSELASYRPVSLTSCVAKVLERMIAERLYHLAEVNNWFTSLQAGFRKGFSCVDQIIRLSQAIEDGFQQRKMNRAIMVLLDYSKAFDTVWRSRLLVSMSEKGVPAEYIMWLNGFLTNRQARVRLHGVKSSSKQLHQGVPQGCVLSPLLFLFFINNLAEKLYKVDPVRAARLVISLFADDVTIVARDHVIENAVADAQWAVDVVSEWSKEWKLDLNASKSEVTFFSRNTHESKYEPSLHIKKVDKVNGTVVKSPIPFNPTPTLLGVIYDRTLSFREHTVEVCKAASNKVGMIAAVGNSQWGWNKEHLRQLYFAFLRSKMDYSGPGWQPWLCDSYMNLLERTQNKALRLITGQFHSSPVESLRLEASVTSYTTHSHRNTLKSIERAKRLPPHHPVSRALAEHVKPRTQHRSWARQGKQLSTEHIPPETELRQEINLTRKPPWVHQGTVTIFSSLEGVSNKADDPATIRSAAEAAIARWNSDLTIFTDGSAVSGFRQGGAAAVVMINDDPPRFETLRTKGAAFTSSFEEECSAMELAIDWITAGHCTPSSRPLIITDSQSLCKALEGVDSAVDPLRKKLASCSCNVGIQWVPGHCGIPGNELADQAANEARTISGPRRPSTYKALIPVINQHVTDPPCRPKYDYIAEVYSKMSRERERTVDCKKDAVYLAQLRSGHHRDLRSYQHRVTKDTSTVIEPNCPRCGFSEESISHLFDCPGTLALRHELFGTVEVPISSLTLHPRQSITLARRSLRGVRKQQSSSQAAATAATSH